MKSSAHTRFSAAGGSKTWSGRLGGRRFVLRGRFSPSERYTRLTRLWFHLPPVQPKPVVALPEAPPRSLLERTLERIHHLSVHTRVILLGELTAVTRFWS